MTDHDAARLIALCIALLVLGYIGATTKRHTVAAFMALLLSGIAVTLGMCVIAGWLLR